MIYDDNQIKVLAGFFLKRLRLQHRISEKELGILLNVSQQQISRYEKGVTSLTIVRVNQYLKVFGLNWNDFIEGLETEESQNSLKNNTK
jgi:transcriptional regulator with XRE-family HTH domain